VETKSTVSKESKKPNKTVRLKNRGVQNPECKPSGRAGGRTRNVDGTSDKIVSAAAANKSSETRPKRRCRQLSSYNETVNSDNQSSSSAESHHESSVQHLEQQTVTIADKRMTSQHQRSSETEKTVTRRCAAMLVTHHHHCLCFSGHFPCELAWLDLLSPYHYLYWKRTSVYMLVYHHHHNYICGVPIINYE